MVYKSNTFRALQKGDALRGYIKEVREDEKIDVSLTPLGYHKVEEISKKLLDTLKTNEGFLPIHDKSDPEEIYSLLQCSKKSFKQAVGALYKKQLISLDQKGIYLIKKALD